jgi:hypothetical protein
VSAFFIDTSTGQVATLAQLVAGGVTASDETPPRPWHPVRGDRDASTLWYAVMRKQVKHVFIGTLCIRHSDHHASLLQQGWQEVPVEEVGESLRGFAGGAAAEVPDGLAGLGG